MPLVAVLYGLYGLLLLRRRRRLLLLLLCAKLLPLLVHMVLWAPRIIGVVPRLLAAVADELATLRRSGVAVRDHGHPANSGEDSESRIVPKISGQFMEIQAIRSSPGSSGNFRNLQDRQMALSAEIHTRVCNIPRGSQ